MDAEDSLHNYQAVQRWNGGTRPAALGRTRRRKVSTEDKAEEQYYTVACENNLQKLIQAVNRLCQDGWTLLGGVQTMRAWTTDGRECVYYLQSLWDPQAFEAETREATDTARDNA